MAFVVQAETPPVHEDADGALRVGDSRVLLELVIRAFQDGATPETIAQRFATAALPDIYAVIAYYLRHPGEIEAYLVRREKEATSVYQRITLRQGDMNDLRARLLARRPA